MISEPLEEFETEDIEEAIAESSDTELIPMGMFTKNIQCQEKLSDIHPPKLGPITKPNSPGIVIRFIILSRSFLGN